MVGLPLRLLSLSNCHKRGNQSGKRIRREGFAQHAVGS